MYRLELFLVELDQLDQWSRMERWWSKKIETIAIVNKKSRKFWNAEEKKGIPKTVNVIRHIKNMPTKVDKIIKFDNRKINKQFFLFSSFLIMKM